MDQGISHRSSICFTESPLPAKGVNKCKSGNCAKPNLKIKPRAIIYILNNIEGCALHIPVLLRLFHHERFISSINYLVHLS